MNIAPTPKTQTKPKRVNYPVRDGKPMAETDKHADLMTYSKEALRFRYAEDPNVYVSGNNFLFYEEGNAAARISPDCYVVFGVVKHQRDSYKVWEEAGHLPAVVFEFTSKKTQQEDVTKKRPLYEKLRIPEYFQFDPTGDYLNPRLQGFRLNSDGVYEALPLQNNRLYSEQLGLDLVQEGEAMRFYDPLKQEWLLSSLEMARKAEGEQRRANAEALRAAEAEAEIAQLRAELEALRNQSNAS